MDYDYTSDLKKRAETRDELLDEQVLKSMISGKTPEQLLELLVNQIMSSREALGKPIMLTSAREIALKALFSKF